MIKLNSIPLKFLILVVITIMIYTSWSYGLETVYARVLLVGTNTTLGIVKSGTSIELEPKDDKFQFRVRTLIDGRRASFPQEFGSLLQPTVIILSWQLFLFLILGRGMALRSAGFNLGMFYLLQIFFLILLTGYHTSETSRFIYVMFMDKFYIVGVILVIKDNMLYPIFRKQQIP